ncbi:MAG: heterodisulfide reductase-related iron-sulfur binding cluster [Crenarchaeota archaeon]|nr:heterodisulfide reductase-related iron-sulfur binding cluster [Thermoproteota archaeon]MDW8033864.1 heterodisulfide reductase-related iron-sulfur binding cluster [Nitrososphaerota archaeon]
MSMSIYLGCIVRTLYPEVEKAVNEVLNRIGVSFEEPKGASCCAPLGLFSLSKDAWLRINERNMRLFQSNVLTACDNCFASLSDAFRIISEKNGVKVPEVKPFGKFMLEVLGEKEHGLSFKGLRCAVQHSCHLLRPNRDIDNAEDPRIVKSVLGRLGYFSIPYEGELDCCGGLLFEETISKMIVRRKTDELEKSGADCVVTTCSHCMHQLRRVSRLPVLHLAQLSALSMGANPREIGIPDTLLRRIVNL